MLTNEDMFRYAMAFEIVAKNWEVLYKSTRKKANDTSYSDEDRMKLYDLAETYIKNAIAATECSTALLTYWRDND